MPYIKKHTRIELDIHLRELIEELRVRGWNEGDVNYALTRIVWEWFFMRKRYATINAIRGVLGCVWAEFYRRVGGPYEDEAIEKNGDILTYKAEQKRDLR
jgi:hypothetical protein